MSWYVVCMNPKVAVKVTRFPLTVGREAIGANSVIIDSPTVSRRQFTLEKRLGKIYFVNQSQTDPGVLDGEDVHGNKQLSEKSVHLLQVGSVAIAFGTDYEAACAAARDIPEDRYCARVNGEVLGPWTGAQLVDACENGIIKRNTMVWTTRDEQGAKPASEWVDFGEDEMETEAIAAQTERRRTVSAEEAQIELGENFMCPYCRTVSDLEDVLSVSVSPGLMGDPVLGESEQARFLPSQFTGNGLAIDSEGGVCTEIACPRCHMSLPRSLLETPQMVMSVIGMQGSGKSFFLASSMWQCSQMLHRLFGVGFTDLDPAANSWINSYIEKLFFQADDTTRQKIEKTDQASTTVSREVMLDGAKIRLPLPCFFQISGSGREQLQSLVVYDSAGENFLAGNDSPSNPVTLNMVNSDTLFFMFDPTADPRFRHLLEKGSGTVAQMLLPQKVLLSEMATRIRRHLGNRGERKLSRPLIFGVAKADLLARQLPLDSSIYRADENGHYALNIAALRDVSRQTEALLDRIVPEVTATAHDIAEDVWFLPVSALGHNPVIDGVRPCDIKPVWAELPVVFTLAKKGLVPTVGGDL